MSKPNFLQRVGAAASVFTRGVSASAGFAGTAFKGEFKAGDLRNGGFKFWRPALASPDREWLRNRDTVVARARDLERNDTAVASATRRRVSSAAGTGWRLSARVDGEALGFDAATTLALNRAIEREFQSYAYGHRFEMDAQRQQTFGGILRTIAHSWFVDGEAFPFLEWAEAEPGARWSTRVNVIDTDRVSNPNCGIDTATLRAGVELAPFTAAPIAYHVRTRHQNDVGPSALAQWVRVERWTPWGRPQALHVYDRKRPGQSRGVSQLTAALLTVHALDRFGEATLENSILNALLLGAIESNSGPAAVSESFSTEDLTSFEDSRSAVYDGRTVDLSEGVKIPVLPLGDKLNLYTQSRDVASFEAFTRATLRRVAASVGTTYEELAMDYSTTNYSSARAAMLHAFAETQMLQTLIRDQFVQPMFVAWLEEAVEIGRVELPVGAPDYWENLEAYTRARWIAPGRGYIDPTKEIQAQQMKLEVGVSTLEDECAEQGKDWREVLEQLRREADERARLGLQAPAGVTAAAAAAPQIAAPEAQHQAAG